MSILFESLTALTQDAQTVTLDPPLPIYLLNLVAGLREKNAKGYPVKKVRKITQGIISEL
jgi:N1221-like protein